MKSFIVGPMDILAAIEARRAVKHYDPEHVMSDDEIRQLIETAILAPSSFNIQHWRFVLVRDVELRQKIRAVAWDQAQVTEASLLIVMCGDIKAWEKEPARYWRNAPQAVQDFLVPAIGPFHEGNEQLQRDEAMRSTAFAGMTLMLAAKAMGYDSCPMVGFDVEAVSKLIKLPPDHAISYMITVGKAVQPAWPKGGQLGFDEVTLTDTY